jgi:hypothetical protein
MAPPARPPGTSTAERPGASSAEAGGASPVSGLPEPLGPAGFSLIAAAILSDQPGDARGRRVLVGGALSAPVAGRLCGLLARSARCVWLDLTSPRLGGDGLSEVLAGTVPLSRVILSREGGFDRLHGGAGHPDELIRRPHDFAIALDALSFAYEVVVMSAPERDESIVAEVLAGICDQAILAHEGDADRSEALSYARRGAARVGILDPDGHAAWLAESRQAVLN